jgi:hypothetical protein
MQVTQAINDITEKYQKVRFYANNILDVTSIWFGALSTAILPILYALLGAYASVLRAFTRQMENGTFNTSYASPARFIIAAIGGGLIGHFNFTIGEWVTVSPLAFDIFGRVLE